MEVSAKSNIGVEQAFFKLAGQIKKRIIDTQAATGPGSPAGAARNNVTVGGAGAQDQGAAKGCC